MENRFDLLPYLLVLLRAKKAITLHFLIIFIVSFVYAFFIARPEFKAEMTFLPPPNQNTFEGILPEGISLPLSVGSSDILPEQIETIFSSNALKRKTIDKFNLYEHYKLTKNKNKFIFASKCLRKDLLLSSEEKGSMTFPKTISLILTAYHSSPDTAVMMANYSFKLLDSAVRAISADRARRNREFVEKQLQKNRALLDSINGAMMAFQFRNKAYNIPEQAKRSIAAYAELKAAMQLNEIRMQAIKSEFSRETPEINALRKMNEAYLSKLSVLETKETPDALPSLQSATRLFPQYSNLLRDVEVENQVILLLTRELEQAKLKEENTVSSLCIVDPAFVPEYKDRPKRMFIIGIWVTVYLGIICSFFILLEIYRIQLKDSRTIRSIKDSFVKKNNT